MMIPSKIRRARLWLAERIRPADPPSAPPPEIYHLGLGRSYPEYWNNLARDKETAYFGVAGKPFGQPATEASLDRHGEASARIIAKQLELGVQDRVLEVGVGVGRLAKHIAPLCRHFTGVDISANMIGFARERLAGLDNALLLPLDSSGLRRFPGACFDKVYFQVVLIHLDREDVFHYLGEAFRVLRPAGRAWFQFYNLLHPRGFREFHHAVEFLVAKGDKLRGRVQCLTPAEVRKYVTAAGFKLREDLSHLREVEQNFDFEIPDKDWEFYLIAVAEKP
jgi:ubiquinone/menaquinone biosynthesis C-methylase UbiE